MTTTRTTAARRYSLPFGDLLGQTLSIYFRNIVPFTVLGAIVLAPWAAMVLGVQSRFDPSSRDFEPGDLLAMVAVSLGTSLLQMLLTFVLTGAVSYGVVQQLRGQPAGMGQALQMGLKSLGRSLGTGFLVGLRVILFSLLLLIPGIMEAVRLYVAIPAAVMEERGGSHAIERSKSLTDGSRWSIFGAHVVLLIAGGMVAGMIVFVTMMLSGGLTTQPKSTAVDVVAIVLTILTQGLTATMGAVAYFMLRRGKENVDPAAIASVFD